MDSTLVCIFEAFRPEDKPCIGPVLLAQYYEPHPKYPEGVTKIAALCEECRIVNWAYPLASSFKG